MVADYGCTILILGPFTHRNHTKWPLILQNSLNITHWPNQLIPPTLVEGEKKPIPIKLLHLTGCAYQQ